MVQVGDKVWVRQVIAEPERFDSIGICDSDDCPEWEVRTATEYIPDLPGVDLAALVAVIAEEGMQAVFACCLDLLSSAMDRDESYGINTDDYDRVYDIITRLMAALEVK